MAQLSSPTPIQVESIIFPPSFKPPAATNALILGGAGVRLVEIQGKLIKMTGLAMYLDNKAISSLEAKWKGKSAKELEDSDEFYKDLVTGAFEKLIQITMLVPMTGVQLSGKVAENCVAIWKAQGTYTDTDGRIIEKFLEVFKDQIFSPGSSVLLAMSSNGSLMITFLKDGLVPETVNAVLESEKLGQALFEMMIGKNGVSPAAKQSLASRLYDLMKASEM